MSASELFELEKEVLKEKYESEIKTLRQESEYGAYGDMDWMKETTGIGSPDLVKELILYPFRDELERKVVYYPSGRGKPETPIFYLPYLAPFLHQDPTNSLTPMVYIPSGILLY